MSHVTASSVPTEKISSVKNTNIYDVVISALTSKNFKVQNCKLLASS